jgi:acetyl-CoA carboxylase biotin carboxyl carrier protein
MAKKPSQASSGIGDLRAVDLSAVERLLKFMQDHGLEEFEYEQPGVHIRLKKASAHSRAAIHSASTPEPAPLADTHSVAHPAGLAGAPERASGEFHLIKSPIVGTFYAAPSPGAEPFVARGARVEPGQVLCIIEAMKLMNEIESDVTGEVVETLVENGSPVEYGQPLFKIRPLAKKK